MDTRLKPCPFCGGSNTQIRLNGRVWMGQRYSEPVSVSIIHWCEGLPRPSRLIERIGENEEQAIERWNNRVNFS